MSIKKSREGICSICGEFKKLSFEHVPPQSAFNNKPIFFQTHEHLIDNGFLFGKKKRSPKGFGKYTLCESCNNNTGDWYARDFSDFAHQGMKIINDLKELQYIISGTYRIKPLNILKQILTMFMSADSSGYLRSQKELVEFILEKDKIGLPKKYKIFIYSNMSKKKRMMGYSVVYAGSLGVQKWSEINFQPFGYLLAEDSSPAHPHMCDISQFGDFPFDKKVEVNITMPYLEVDTPWIGTYKNVK